MTPIEVAITQIGITESPPNSNNVKYNTWYYGREVWDGLWGTTFSWCMTFVEWCFNEAGYKLPYKTASCNALLNWYKAFQPWRIVKTPKQNDIIIYNFGHTGIVESATSTTVKAIEGNTSISGSQDNGGMVCRKVRPISQVTAFIRPFDEYEDDEMTQEQFNTMMEEYLTELRAKPESAWSVKEGAWAKATKDKVVNGQAPQMFITRQEVTAILDRLNLIE